MAGTTCIDQNPEYWDQYSNLQHVKHGLIREYLNGWFPILGSWARRVLYIDTHAGRGRHATGDLGSPLVSLKTLLDHTHCERILGKCEVRFVLMERDPSSLRALEDELASFEPLPAGVVIEKYAADFHDVMSNSLAYLKASGKAMAPAFIFVDPYGFKLSYALLRDFMSFRRVELFVNVMWRYLDMAIAQARNCTRTAALLDFVFDRPAWRSEIASDDFETRCGQAISFVQRTVGARWATSVRMLGANNSTEYVLLHLSNHDRGRDLMKTVMWKVCPSCEGTFIARKSEDPDQGVLLTPHPDLRPLEAWVLATLQKRATRWQGLQQMVRDQSWLDKHLNQVVRALRHRSLIVPTDYDGMFAPKSDPLLSLSVEGRAT